MKIKFFLVLILFIKSILNQRINNDYHSETGTHPHKIILQHQLNNEPEVAFKNWHYLHEKDYHIESEEGKLRFQNFKENFDLIKNHNKENHPYKLGLNHFADFTLNEFHEKFSNINSEHFKKMKAFPSIKNPNENKPTEIKEKSQEYYNLFWNTPDEVEEEDLKNYKKSLRFLDSPNETVLKKSIVWNKKAKLENWINNQGKCGSCWAFSAVQSLEAAFAIKTGQYEAFSKQQLVDCDPVSNGCNGGLPHTGYEFFKKNGILTEKQYPYKNDLTVKYKKDCILSELNKKGINSNLKVKDYELCFQDEDCHNDERMFEMLKKGPLAACVDASKKFMLYESGVFEGPCSEKNHAILISGYHKAEKEGEDSYWLVKNSWGFFWGDIGFIKIKQSKDYNSCLLTDYYARPIIDLGN